MSSCRTASRLGDVATVTLGPRDGDTALRSNGKRASASASSARRNRIRSTFRAASRRRSSSLSKTLPEGTTIAITSDDAVFIQGAIHEVVLALMPRRRHRHRRHLPLPARLAGNA